MPAFCTKCGTSLPSSTGFCPACGAPVGAGGAVFQPGFVTPAPPGQPAGSAPPPHGQRADLYPVAPPAAYPVVVPAQGSGGALKIVLIVLAAVVGLGVLVVGILGFVGWRAMRSVHVDGKGNATISALGGNISAGKDVDLSERDLGVPLYPGAARGEGGMRMTLPTMTMVSAVFVTDDPVSTVVAFYKGKLGEDETDVDSGDGSVMSSGRDSHGSKNSTVITVGPGTGNTRGKTKITIVRTVSTRQ